MVSKDEKKAALERVSRDEKKAALKRHKDARAALERLIRSSTDVSDAYLAANRKVIDAEKSVPWWRR